MDESPRALPRTIGGRYTIGRELGRGATAIVYAAHDVTQGRSVAVKLLRPALAESIVAGKFVREIRKTSGLKHPNIVPVLDAGEDNGQLFCVLPLMEGTLRERLERDRQLPIADANRVTREIAEALSYCHAQGLIHRDVKPENILFSGNRAHLSDFGIARALERAIGDTATTTGLVRGTPAYMSPEQASGDREYDGRSDVYSLGCVLYEMIAGMPAFIGPTAEAVIAQRFSHAPRELTAYRPSVPSELEAVVVKTLQLTPADRFTASELAEVLTALEQHRAHPLITDLPRRSSRARLVSTRTSVFAAAAILILAGAVGVEGVRGWRSGVSDSPLDTTRIVVLPFAGSSDSGLPWRHEDLLYQSLARWRGVQVVDRFQVADALRRGRTPSAGAAAQLARSLGAGRYIRSELGPSGTDLVANVTVYDAGSARALYSARQRVPNDLDGAAAAYSRIADTLLLRGAPSDSIAQSALRSRSLPAVQAFGRAQLALDEWNLMAADSAFQTAISYDSDYASASFWLAQVRAWRGQSVLSWRSLTERAIALEDQLSDRERALLRALHLGASGDWARACTVYDQLRKRHDRDFAAWFGLGQCQFPGDRIVVPDSLSPSGWRFRSSVNGAMQAYSRAFELLPSVHRGYERGAFERLRRLLLVSHDLFPGYGAADSAAFYGRPGWIGDSLVLVPYPARLVFDGDPGTIPPGFHTALARRAAEFRRIAAAWSAAFPRSAGAKHAVAVALELAGDPRALDTLTLARTLESDPGRRLRLAATEAVLRIKFALPNDVGQLRRARALADSLLKAPATASVEAASALAPLAAILGRCRDAERLGRASAPAGGDHRIPAAFFAESNALSLRLAMSCPVESSEMRSLWDDVNRQWADSDVDERQRVAEMLLQRQVLLAPLLDRTTSWGVMANGRSELAAAIRAILRDDYRAARTALAAADAKATPTLPSPDITLARARMLLLAADSGAASRLLDQMLHSVRAFEVGGLTEGAWAGALVPAIILRAEIAARQQQQAVAQRWAAVAAELWAGADHELLRQLESLVRISKG